MKSTKVHHNKCLNEVFREWALFLFKKNSDDEFLDNSITFIVIYLGNGQYERARTLTEKFDKLKFTFKFIDSVHTNNRYIDYSRMRI